MNKLVFFVGLVLAYDIILKKYDIYGKLESWGMKAPKILNRIANCQFCTRHWLLVPLAILVFFLPTWTYIVFYPMIGASVLVYLTR